MPSGYRSKIKKGILTRAVRGWRSSAFLAFLFMQQALFAQANPHVPSDQRGDPRWRYKSDLDGNNVRVSVFNFGLTGETGPRADEIPFEWPKNTKRHYVALVAIWMGGEVVGEDGEKMNVVDVPNWRLSPSGSSWNMEPVPGFLNPYAKAVARSDDPNTWPTAAQGGWRDKREDPVDPGWVGSWNGFFGKNIFNADQEMFYRISDDLYDRPDYVPDRTDPTRGGLGLLVDVRVMAWSQVLISDVVFVIHDILNDGTKRIPKSSFLIWLADIVGGDYLDDEPYVDVQTSTAFLTDADRVGNEAFGSDPVGVAAVKFIETPGNEVDGIDNDGDADSHLDLLARVQGDAEERIPHFSDADFDPRVLGPGDKIVLIDSLSFERRIVVYPAEGGAVVSLGKEFRLPVEGITLAENDTANSIDDDLDGLIDEKRSLHLERFDEISGVVKPVRFIHYLSFAIGDTVKRGFAVAGKNAEWSYANVAPMMDESRDDGFDNDGDWDPHRDDVGMDGVRGTMDTGEGDGFPTSGAGTDFPGEPNIDRTDVSETDLIGLTSAVQDPEGALNFNTAPDESIWKKFMTPGEFYLPRPTGAWDTFVSSGYFPLEPGQRQRMAVSVAIAGGGNTKRADEESAIRKQRQAYLTYESDYQFAEAPNQVTMTAVAGDGKVTLYWDDMAEVSVDRFIERIAGPGQARDFEGYRIYRSTDAAFLDAKTITDGSGVLTFLQPIVQYDLKDGIQGYHPVDINGVKYFLGEDTGIVHTFTDSNLINGQRYFYAVTAYDFGYEAGNIPPTETSVQVRVDPQGNITTGSNVAVVRPRAPAAGYVQAGVTAFEHESGSATGTVGLKIIDPGRIKDGHIYEITFQDTLIEGFIDTLTTAGFTLRDETDDAVLLEKCGSVDPGDEIPVIDGFQLFLRNDQEIRIDEIRSGWNDEEVFPFEFSPISFIDVVGKVFPYDYQVVFGEIGFGSSKDTSISFLQTPSRDVNFQVWNLSTGMPVEFAFVEIDGDDGRMTIDPDNANKTDTIFLLEEGSDRTLVYTWQLIFNLSAGGRNPQPGDTLEIALIKPFLSADVYRIQMKGEGESRQLAKDGLSKIQVVPNPYIAAEIWEPRNPFASGRGPREIHFINLPRKCTIRIFNVNGVLVDKIEHESTLDNGTAVWDVLSKDHFEISFGIYVYLVEAPDIGQKTGTFAVIK